MLNQSNEKSKPTPLEESEERRREARTATAPQPKKSSSSASRYKTLVEAGGMKKGGMVSSVSKRADGIAKRGKTHCKIC